MARHKKFASKKSSPTLSAGKRLRYKLLLFAYARKKLLHNKHNSTVASHSIEKSRKQLLHSAFVYTQLTHLSSASNSLKKFSKETRYLAAYFQQLKLQQRITYSILKSIYPVIFRSREWLKGVQAKVESVANYDLSPGFSKLFSAIYTNIFGLSYLMNVLRSITKSVSTSLSNTERSINKTIDQADQSLWQGFTGMFASIGAFLSAPFRKTTSATVSIPEPKPEPKSTQLKINPKTTQTTIFPPRPVRIFRFLKSLLHPFGYTARNYPWQTAFSIILSATILGGTYFIHENIFKDLPSPRQLSDQEPVVTTKILDRNGQVLFRIYDDQNRSLVPLSRIPEHTVQATIAIEDQHFYNHHGFSITGISRALVSNFQGNAIQGGSTLTQQLIKNKLLTSERTISRKVREVLLSVLAEGIYTKDEILEMYFNQIAYGGSIYGIEEAAQGYFGKSAQELTLAESALLAGLPAAPSVYTPFGPNPDLAYERQREVLRRMVEDEYITAEEAQAAAEQKLVFREDRIDIRAPHFVMYVRKLLAERYGEEILTRGGLIVRTSLDIKLHDEMQNIITEEIDSLERLRISNGAGLITNPRTGEILAMVGSTDYFDFEHDGQVNVTLRPRQPGSSIKPLTYALALEHGKTPTSIIDDSPITYNIAGSRPYSPSNYDGAFHGKVTLRQALANSYNIPAVKLLNEVGVHTFIDKAEEMGISTWTDRKRFGLSLTLGGGEVLMTDMAVAYSSFANSGRATDLNPFLEIKNYKGEQLYYNSCALDDKNCTSRQVLSPRNAFLISDILSDNQARTPAFGPLSTLYIPNQKVAVKTGTTNNLRDNWTIGFTSERLVAVWVGNNDNKPMSYVASGVTGASPIWNKVIQLQLDPENPHTFPVPPGIEKIAVCTTTGTRACSGCPSIKEEYFITGTGPKRTCNPTNFQVEPPIAGNPEATTN